MTRLGELPASTARAKAPAHYARPLGRGVLITGDGGGRLLLSAAEYEAFSRGAASGELSRRLEAAGFSAAPAVDRAAEALYPRSALSWRGPARVVLLLERGGQFMDLDRVEAAVDFAFTCGPDAPALDLVAEDAGKAWPAVWLAVQRALRRGEWSRRPARIEVRARRLPPGDAAVELSRLGVGTRLVFDLDGAPPGPEARADAALAIVKGAARAPERWVDWLREAGFGSYRLLLPETADLKAARAFAAFHAAAVERLVDGADRSDLLDDGLTDLLRGRPLALPGLDLLGEIAVDTEGSLATSERALRLGRKGQEAFSLGDIYASRFEELPLMAAARAALAAADADRQPLCCQCAYRPYCRTAPSQHFARSGSAWGRLPESPECAARAAFLDRIFALQNSEKFNILLRKSNIDRV